MGLDEYKIIVNLERHSFVSILKGPPFLYGLPGEQTKAPMDKISNADV